MKKYEDLSSWAKNSLDLYRNGSIESIKRLLNYQDEAVVDELREFTGAKDDDELAARLSLGAYSK